jgi:hypothetical protein
MAARRRLAARLLDAVIRGLPPASQPWGQAMLRELDDVEGEWAALLWALGGTTALFRHAAPLQFRRRLGQTVAVLSGVAIAGGILGVFVFGVLRAAPRFLEGSPSGRDHILVAMVLSETIYLVAAVVLWRQRRSFATGFLLAAITLLTHVIVYSANHG